MELENVAMITEEVEKANIEVEQAKAELRVRTSETVTYSRV